MEDVSRANVCLGFVSKGCDPSPAAVTKIVSCTSKRYIYIKRQRIYVYVHVAPVQYIFLGITSTLCAVVSIKYILCKSSDISS